ncbi:FUSC family protein [Calidifontibacter sp. DB0510]|uniref:FUSC family protein n=1 Tax=Metallococcus carri TaxID=1656884 RepID=A0A967EF96_9MICO|nr:FUSC family protein [Metallococcus carri]NHN56431.1 FUSC family protein [Metallococcus carri]NOP36055.1 FUSC family protein [Calidifontibacter sp. DB2511S]
MAWGLPETVSGHLTTFTEVKPAPGRWKFALHATACCAAAVTAVAIVFGPRTALLAITGAMISTTAATRPWRARIPILLVMDAAYLVACSLGALVGERPVLLTALLTLLSSGAALVYHAVLADPPGPIFLLIGPAIASYLPTVGMPVTTVIGVTALSAVTASLTSIVLQSTSAERAEDDAVQAAEEEVLALMRASESAGPDAPEVAALRDQAYAAVFSASLVLEESVGRDPHGQRWKRLTKRLRRLHRRVITVIAQAEFPGAAVAINALEQRRYLGSPGLMYLLRWGLSRRAFPWFAARRIGLAILLTCLTTYAIGVSHPYWAVMTTAIVMSLGTDRLSLTHRAMHRLVGTIAGVLLFFVIHALGLRGIDLIVVALVLVYLLQLTAVRNYAIAVFFVTPMALLISTAGHPDAPILRMVGERIGDTAVGVVCSLIVMWATGHRTPIALVRRQFRRTLRTVERLLLLLADGAEGSDAGFVARRDLAYEELQTARILRISQQELPTTLAGWESLESITNRICYTVLAACWLEKPLEHLDAAAMAAALQRVLAGLPPVNTRLIDLTDLQDALRKVREAGIPA